MKKIVYYIGILVCMGFSSCIGEDLSICRSNGIIPQFILVPYEGNNIINDSLYSAKVYVFNKEEVFVTSYEISGRPELNKAYTPDWTLPPGKYYFNVWLNYKGQVKMDSCIAGQTSMRTARVNFEIPAAGVIDERSKKIPFLCYGELEQQEVDASNYVLTIPVMQLTNTINLRVTGLTDPESSLEPSLVDIPGFQYAISADNRIYTLDGNFDTCPDFTYMTVKQGGPDTLETTLTILKLSKERANTTISFTNLANKKELFSGNLSNNLIDLILSKYPDIDFDKNHDYYLEINSGPPQTEITLKLTINGWSESTSDEVLDIYK
ncbi:MAG: FimB/Mfa2 family fimbrial subunit [Dysgonamonadaceae bacterium]|jgi:hypothetical protein|nr:FimB/Mfa2 family fimbrial subunit [Dysgonamonadaceae bacterium]